MKNDRVGQRHIAHGQGYCYRSELTAPFEFVPLNADFKTMRSDQQPIRIVGVMVEHRKYRRKR